VLRTASQQGRDPVELLARLLRTPVPIMADLAIPGHWRPSHALYTGAISIRYGFLSEGSSSRSAVVKPSVWVS
jgi:hypothetical protein